MRITICGHAGLLVEIGAERVLVDPILRPGPLGIGSTVYSPAREVTVSRMPPISTLVLTHAHFDHFDPDSLALLGPDTRVLIPRDPRMRQRLTDMGFRRLEVLPPWKSASCGALSITATPSSAPVVEDEYGVLFRGPSGSMWHMSDAEVDASVGSRIRRESGPIDVVSLKYQPQAKAHLQTMFSLGAELDKQEIIGWLEAGAACQPKLAFPYAAGVIQSGADEWMNRYIFPLPASHVVSLMNRRLEPDGRARALMPGDVVEVVAHEPRVVPQSAAFVRHVPERDIDTVWEPIDASHLPGPESEADVDELLALLDQVLGHDFARWLVRELDGETSYLTPFVDYGVCWQLIVHLGRGERATYSVDFGARPLALQQGVADGANYFAHLAGAAVLRALRTTSRAQRNLFTCAELRLHERILHVRDRKFWQPPVKGARLFLDALPEPFSYFLTTRQDGLPIAQRAESSKKATATL